MGWLTEWLVCVCSVRFDVDMGHTLQHIWPPNVLSENEIQKLLTLSLPDHSDRHDATGDSFYLFRFRHDCKIPLDSSSLSSQTFSMGYVLFRSLEDSSLRRKYNQESLVVLTPLLYVSFFKAIVEFLTPLYFFMGSSVFESFCNAVDLWPKPASNLKVTLVIDEFFIELNTPLSYYPASILPTYQKERNENELASGESIGASEESEEVEANDHRTTASAEVFENPAQEKEDSSVTNGVVSHGASSSTNEDSFVPEEEYCYSTPLILQKLKEATVPQQSLSLYETNTKSITCSPFSSYFKSDEALLHHKSFSSEALSLAYSYPSFPSEDPYNATPVVDSSFLPSKMDCDTKECKELKTQSIEQPLNKEEGVEAEEGEEGNASTVSMPSIVKHMLSTMPGSFQEVNIYDAFEPLLHHMWLLWELAIIGESMLIVCPSASWSSNFVLSLLSIIEPLTYCGDFRPYFNAFDPDFHIYCSMIKRQKMPTAILGVSNPFFLEAMKAFPTKIVCASRNPSSPSKSSEHVFYTKFSSNQNGNSWISTHYTPLLKKDKHLLKRLLAEHDRNDSHISSINCTKNSNATSSGDNPLFRKGDSKKSLRRILDSSGFRRGVSKYSIQSFLENEAENSLKRTDVNTSIPIKTDKSSRKLSAERPTCSVTKSMEAVSAINNLLIRKHFTELTASFIEPFKEFFSMDFSSSSVPFDDVLTLPSFSENVFFSKFQPKGSFANLSKSKCLELYKRFIHGVNFRSWCNQYAAKQVKVVRHQYLLQCLEFDYEEHLPTLDLEKLIDGYTNIQNLCTSNDTPFIDRLIAKELLAKIKKMISTRLMEG